MPTPVVTPTKKRGPKASCTCEQPGCKTCKERIRKANQRFNKRAMLTNTFEAIKAPRE